MASSNTQIFQSRVPAHIQRPQVMSVSKIECFQILKIYNAVQSLHRIITVHLHFLDAVTLFLSQVIFSAGDIVLEVILKIFIREVFIVDVHPPRCCKGIQGQKGEYHCQR